MRPMVSGVGLDPQTRCTHYHGPLDVIAIKMACCGIFYACRECHDEMAGHAAEVWPIARRGEAAVLCGACGRQMAISDYLRCDNRCRACGAPFNPRCALHHHLYFEPG